MVEGEGTFFGDFEIGEVVIPNALGGFAFGEENEVSFYASTGAGEDATGEADDAPHIGFVEELAFGLDKGFFIGWRWGWLSK